MTPNAPDRVLRAAGTSHLSNGRAVNTLPERETLDKTYVGAGREEDKRAGQLDYCVESGGQEELTGTHTALTSSNLCS